jgi:signal transduction histidine kinase
MGIRSRAALVVLLAVIVASAFSTTLAYQSDRAHGGQTPLRNLALLNTSFWFAWGVLAWPLASLSYRFRIDRSPRLAVPLHIGALVVAATIHIAQQTTAQVASKYELMRKSEPEALASFSWTDRWSRLFPQQLGLLIDWELVAGAGIIGFAHAFFYYRENQQRAVREAALEMRLVEARLQTLQRQLHPHFLFNTLHAISALMHRDVHAAERMLIQLSDLLRMSLDIGKRPDLRLGEELDFLEKYVQIEQVRLGDRLTVRFDIDPDTLDAMVPALILQPLVENAVKHGIAPLGRPGEVAVVSRREGDMLLMTVTDSGLGPSEHALAALSTGIGVSNTRARLEHQFGPHFRFEFKRHPGGFTVLVAIPFREDAESGGGTASQSALRASHVA